MVRTPEPSGHGDPSPGPLPEMDWEEIAAPGCYLLVASGLLARIYPDEARARLRGPRMRTSARVVRLSENPGDPLQALRLVASQHGYPVRF